MKPVSTTVDRSYQLLALLEVCEHSARHISDLPENHVAAAAGNLADTLKLASEIADEVHNHLELAELAELAEKPQNAS